MAPEAPSPEPRSENPDLEKQLNRSGASRTSAIGLSCGWTIPSARPRTGTPTSLLRVRPFRAALRHISQRLDARLTAQPRPSPSLADQDAGSRRDASRAAASPSGFSKRCPSTVSAPHVWQGRCRPTPACSALAVFTASTVCSARCAAASCPRRDLSLRVSAAASDPGVRAVSRGATCDRRSLSPTRTFGPSRAFPCPSAVSRHRDPCLLAVLCSPPAASPRWVMAGSALLRRPSSRRFVVPGPDLKALLVRPVRCPTRRLRRIKPDALLGFVPLQGFPRLIHRGGRPSRPGTASCEHHRGFDSW